MKKIVISFLPSYVSALSGLAGYSTTGWRLRVMTCSNPRIQDAGKITREQAATMTAFRAADLARAAGIEI